MAVQTKIRVIAVTDDHGKLLQAQWLGRSESVHRQLRPDLPADYSAQMQGLFGHGARMAVAAEGDVVRGVTVWRLQYKTATPKELYVDDLVTDAGQRSTGVGRSLLAWLQAKAREHACLSVCLDSGTQRLQAHRFYFRENFLIRSFHFVKPL
jgi:GNAT superfamily N-acetyltransferase